MPYITGLGGVPGAGYFTDSNGNPKLLAQTETWGLLVRAGLNSGGDWQGDIDGFLGTRAAQGFTAVIIDPVWTATSVGGAYHGNTWDGLTPLAGGSVNPSAAALNDPFWARTDYMFTSAAAQGITLMFDINNVGDNTGAGNFYDGWTTAQWTAYGSMIGARYAATPNLIWLAGNDAFSPGPEANWAAAKTAIQAAGDTHLWGAWYNAETTSRYDTSAGTSEPWGVSNSAFNFCYSYNASYWIIEYAYLEVANKGASSLLPAIWGDGYFYQGGAVYSATLDRALRQEWWWALASGARGVVGESEAIYPWLSGAAAAVASEWFFVNNAPHIISAYTGLTGWHRLIPDTGNALVIGGRGTRVTGFTSGGSGGQYEPAFTNSYVAASRVSDGSLAVLYLPKATTITIDQAKMAAGYGAKWMDPVTGATTAAVTGTTYNSTAQGANSAGDPDWVLILASPPYATWTVP